MKEFNQNYPKHEIERRNRLRIHNALIILERLLMKVEGELGDAPESSVVDLNRKFQYKEMHPYFHWSEETTTQGKELKALVEAINKEKDYFNLLPINEQKLLSDLLIRAKIYLAYYEEDLKRKKENEVFKKSSKEGKL